MVDTKNVVAAVIRHNGTILIAQRPAGDPLEGLWEFPGGTVEEGESDSDALSREIREELSLEIAVGPFLGSSRFGYRHGLIVLRAYLADLMGGIPRLHAHAAAEWIDRRQLDRYRFCAADEPFVTRLREEWRNLVVTGTA